MPEVQQTAHVPQGGSGNVIVQIVGDGNRVDAREPHLTLTTFQNRRKVKTDLERLSPYARSVSLLGRESEMADLQRFCASSDAGSGSVAVRVLTGEGGSGKTRLALELCDTLAAQGWAAGFATGRELQRFAAQQNLSAWGWSRPTLVVVDYAATHAAQLATWLDELAERDDSTRPPLRLLLLERSASRDDGWWRTLFAPGGWGDSTRQRLLDPLDPIPVLPLPAAAQTELIQQVLAWAPQPAPTPAALPQHWGSQDALFLMMAALELNHGGTLGDAELDRPALALRIAERECDRLSSMARAAGLDGDLLLHLAACVTLLGGISRADFLPLADAEKAALYRPSGGDPARLADVLAEALPPGDPDRLNAIQPDWIGEALLLAVWRKETQGRDGVLRCAQGLGLLVVAPTLIRCAQDFSIPQPRALAWLQALADSAKSDLATTQALFSLLPTDSVALRDLNLDLARQLERALAVTTADDPNQLATYAQALGASAVAHGKAGQPEAALILAQQAVALYRQLAQHRPDVFEPYLAGSLNNLANRLSELGRRDDALETAQQAVAIRRQLAQHRPDVFEPDLAMSLNNLANRLSKLGRREEALEAAQQAVALYRQLAQHRLDVFQPDLAMSLNNLATMLSELGRREEALEAARQAVAFYRQLAQHRLDVFQPDLAMSLNNLANRLGELCRREEALEAAQQAAALYRQLAQHRPDVFQPNLAASLNNLANRLGELCRREEALGAAQQAVAIRRQLAQHRPDVFEPDLAMSLNNLANRLRELGRRGEALHAAQQAVDIRKQLAQFRPDVFQPNWATSLMVQALCEVDADPGAAQRLAHEAITLLTPHFIRLPQAHARLLTSCLREYLRFCSLAQTEPDLALLEPLIPYFTRPEEPHD